MNILFHDNQLCERGTSIALFDYAHFNEEILGNTSYICFNRSKKDNDEKVIKKFTDRFPNKVISYDNFELSKEQLKQYCKENKITHSYFIKSGENDGIYLNSNECVDIIHAVFQTYQPHGQKYAYVSKWLSDKISNIVKQQLDYIPHIVNLPTQTQNIRSNLKIPEDALVIGRHGGMDQFDISFVKEAIIEYVSINANCYFIFVNTKKFCDHERILFLDKIVDMQDKSNFINSCDAMIHARSMGESFGLAICEFLYHNKPVFAYNGGNDQHHIELLKNNDCLYNNKNDLLDKFIKLNEGKYENYEWTQLVKQFGPLEVMSKFKEVFLN